MINNILLDAHLHLQDKRFSTKRTMVIQKAIKSGVARMLCNSACEADWQEVADLANLFPQVKPFFGVHPWYAGTTSDDWLKNLEKFAQHSCGIGEIGLDGFAETDIQIQEEVFCAQLELAKNIGKPFVVHCIKKWGLLLNILTDAQPTGVAFMMHSYGGSKELMFKLLDLGAYFSFSTSLAAPSRQKMRTVFNAVPLDRLLLETDAPDQYCQSLKTADQEKFEDGMNEPANMAKLYEYAAGLRGIDLRILTEHIWKNGQIFTN